MRLFKLQCRKLELSAEAAQLYLCPSLVEALRIIAELPNTSQDDVDMLLTTMLDEGKAGDEGKAIAVWGDLRFGGLLSCQADFRLSSAMVIL